jgi:hypothetical protein
VRVFLHIKDTFFGFLCLYLLIMKLNPYAFILIGVFIAIVAISDRQIKQKNIYEKTTNDSCVCLNDSTVFIRKM